MIRCTRTGGTCMESSREHRLLHPGVDFTNRGELKYARAAHLANELRGRIDEWAAAETLLARVQMVDVHTVEFRLILRREPPVEEWSLILGDVLHNLRSVFDNVVWALATLDGAAPKHPSQVTFPVTRDQPDWDKRTGTLESIPVDLLERIRALQPWASGVDREESLLWLLHRFDIIDKHQGLITASLHLKRLLTGGINFGHASVEAMDKSPLSYETRKTPVPFEDGALLLTVRSASQTLTVDPDYRARVDAQFAVAPDQQHIVLLDALIGDLLARTREWLDLVYGGETYAKQMIAGRQASGASISFGYVDEDGTPRLTQLPMTDPMQLPGAPVPGPPPPSTQK
jgi:hypothetical protein